MNLAQHAVEEADFPRALELLDKHRPQPGEPDPRSFEWRYLRRLCQGDQLFTLDGGNVTYSADGERLMSITGPRHQPVLKIWDAQSGKELQKFTLNGGDAQWMVFSPDGQRLASGSDGDKTVKVWDTQSGKELFTLKGGGRDVVFSPDGKRLASPATARPEPGREVNVWDVETGQELPPLKVGPTSSFWNVAFSLDGKRLASIAGWSRTVEVWDAQTGQQLLSLQAHSVPVREVAFSPDGKRLVSRSGYPASSSPESRDPGAVNVWDAQTGQELFSLKEQSGFTFLTLSPDGKRFATADGNEINPRIRVWDAQTGRAIFTFQGHTSRIDGMAFSADSKRLASSSRDQTLRVWDLQTGEEIRTWRGASRILAFSPDGKRVASAGGGAKVWDAEREQEPFTLKEIGRIWMTSDSDPFVVFSQDLRRVAGVSHTTVKVWDAGNGKEMLTLKGHTDFVKCVAFSPDGKYVASGDGGNPWRLSPNKPVPTPSVVKVWDAHTGHELHTLRGHMAPVFSVAFSPDGKRLASVSLDRTVKVWDTQTGQELFSPTLIEPQFRCYLAPSVAFSPDGRRLAGPVGNAYGGGLNVWDAQTGKKIVALQGHATTVNSLAFSPDRKRLVGVIHKTVKVWDAETGQQLVTFDGHTDWVSSVAFSRDGKRLASVGNDMVKLWDMSGLETLSLKARTEPGGSITFSQDGHRLGSVSVHGTVTIWDATPLPEKP
jgi:WD40 repeat protein